MRSLTSLTTIITGLLLAVHTLTQEVEIEKPWLKSDPKVLKAWQDLHYGTLVCMGPSALSGQEFGWSHNHKVPVEEYDKLYLRYSPGKSDWIKHFRVTFSDGSAQGCSMDEEALAEFQYFDIKGVTMDSMRWDAIETGSFNTSAKKITLYSVPIADE